LQSTFTPGGLNNARHGINKSVRGSSVIRYAGRDISAVSVLFFFWHFCFYICIGHYPDDFKYLQAPATGLKKVHIWEEHRLVSEALFGGELRKPVSVESGIPKFI
jgi:hypothetical protein